MNQKFSSDNSFSQLLTMGSQESDVMSDGTLSQIVREFGEDPLPCIDLLFPTTEPFEEKYDISQPMQQHMQVSHEPLPPQAQMPTNEEFDGKYNIQVLPDQQEDTKSWVPMQQHMQVSHEPLPPQAQMPTNEEFGGKYNFQVLPDQQEDTKSWVYSQKLKKVFIEMEKTLPIRITWTPLFSGLYVKAVMAFSQSSHRSEAVTRCHNHIAVPHNPDSPHLHHVLRCRHTGAMYRDINGHYSVKVPLGAPQPGSDYVQMDLTFHCKNSCSTGINRRPTEVVFNLETSSGEVVGRRKLSVRICSCPKRDKDKEERSVREYSAPKKRKRATGKKFISVYREQLEPDSEVITMPLRIYGRDNYETLKRVAHGLMLTSIERGGPPTVIKPLIDELLRSS